MRKYIEELVVNNYEISGLYELGLDAINSKRAIPLKNVILFDGNLKPIPGRIYSLLFELSHQELAFVLESQYCQKYR